MNKVTRRSRVGTGARSKWQSQNRRKQIALRTAVQFRKSGTGARPVESHARCACHHRTTPL